MRTRIAPTPSGYLHTGNGMAFLFTFLLARRCGAKLLLRIDDLDNARFRPAYLDDIFEQLGWLGIAWEEGPTGPDDFLARWSQNCRQDLYANALQYLRSQGLLYACTCSRSQLAGQELYPRTCLYNGWPLDSPQVTWRFHMKADDVWWYEWPDRRVKAKPAALIGDIVLRKKDGKAAYQLASVVDDKFFDVDMVVRGEDLWPSTAAQVAIESQLAWASRSVRYLHHGLLRDEKGQKLSKSQDATDLRTFRGQYPDPVSFYRLTAAALGLSATDVNSLSDLQYLFDRLSDAQIGGFLRQG